MKKSLLIIKIALFLAGIIFVVDLCLNKMTRKKNYVTIKTRRTKSGAKGDVYGNSVI